MTDTDTRPRALVTGASTGIGRALARQFADHGYDLVIVADEPEIHSAAAELSSYGVVVEAAQVDLTDHDALEGLWQRATAGGASFDAVAINAGVGVNGAFVQNPLEDELRAVALNVTSSVHLAHRALESMVARGSGGVLVTSSIAALAPGPFMAIYGASKAFLYQFVESVRPELTDTGVTVTALMPGATDTEFFERADMTDTKLGQAKKDDPDLVARQGFEALMDGKDKVIAGSPKVKLQAAAAKALPDPLVARVQRSQGEPGGGER